MNLINNETRSYVTPDRAIHALEEKLTKAGMTLQSERWIISVNPSGRFVPTLVGIQYVQFAHYGVMVIS